MELRSRRTLSKPSIHEPAKERQMDDKLDDKDYLPSDCDVSCNSDEGEKQERTVVLNSKTKANSDISDWEDSDSDTYDFEIFTKKRKMGQKKKRTQGNEVEQTSGRETGHLYTKPNATESDILGLDMENKSKRKKNWKGKPALMWHFWEEEHEKWIDENFMVDVDIDTKNEVITETVEAPSDLIMPLLRYQKEWLFWGLKQEESTTRGGILADEMGMGKTIQAIALVLAHREIYRRIRKPDVTSQSPGPSTESQGIKATLVICPVVAVSQWVSEIDRFTLKGSTKVLVYHGANREKKSNQFFDYDFVITTYSTVEAEFRKYMMPPKTKCPYCGNSFFHTKLSIHLRYFCGPNAVRTAKQSKQDKKKFKVVESTSKEKTKSEKDKLGDSESGTRESASKRTSKQQKDDKDTGVGFCEEFEGVVQALPRRKSILHSVKWNRIILDEAHYIKDRRSNTAKAVFALESSYKWALSGTPLQNRVGELYSLIRFLQIVPYSYYLCKDCDCRTLDYSCSIQCSNCPHKSVRNFCWWNKYVANPIKANGNAAEGRRAMILLKHKILKNILLRRTKRGRASDLALPPRIVSLRRDTLDIKEQDYYEAMYNDSQAQFNTYVQAGTVTNNYAHIFDLLTRLRQAVDHPYLVVYSRSAALRNVSMGDTDTGEQVCGICHDPAEDPVVTSCAHAFCKACLIDFSASLGQISCPSCSKPITVDFSTRMDDGGQTNKTTIKGFKSSSILNRIRLDDFQTCTKIDALREEIRFMVERDGAAKGIVFSQFTSFLDLINYSLHKSGISCVQLVGSMSMASRDSAIKKFTDDPNCKIFLMSLKAGGVALNLTIASHVFLMDPWWNPAVERQAQDRIHRIGQYKPIRIVRFIIENTVEERILKLQEKKELVFEGTVGGCSEALGKLTEEDMRFLFLT